MNKLVAVLAAVLFAGFSVVARAASNAPGPPPEQVLKELLEGNARFVAQKAEHPDSSPSDAPQHPIAVILSCSDSRVPSELTFDQGVGKLFVVRAAGNTYDRLGLQSIEYGVNNLGSRLILVIGHDQCGAVTAAVQTYPDPKGGPMLENIYPAVRETKGAPGDPISNAIDANARLTAQRLSHEPGLAEKVKSGEVEILPARYSLATGKVTILRQK